MSEVRILSPRLWLPTMSENYDNSINASHSQPPAIYPTLRLKPGRNASILNRHPWIFSGALTRPTNEIPSGSIVHVVDPTGTIVATGAWSPRSLIAVRVFAFAEAVIDAAWIRARIAEADNRRRILGLGPDTDTTGYRVVFGESDRLPGLVVDRYEDVLVIQLANAGMERLHNCVVDCLIDLFHPRAIYERSDLPSRHEEGLESRTGVCYGKHPGLVEFREHGRRCLADVANGQKTGFYLDQRDLRYQIMPLAAGRRALDVFSFSGATGLAALIGGATTVDFVDTSQSAIDLCLQQAALNGIAESRFQCHATDAFQWVSSRQHPEYDLVMLDPPALIKSQKHLASGHKAYHFLNRAALRLVKDGGMFVTSSCSAFFNEANMAMTLRRAGEQAGVTMSILRVIRQSPDHPLSLNFPEAAYLKSFICHVCR
jgi:23S rRNA (cytosine1962-C5)-methyltransferase